MQALGAASKGAAVGQSDLTETTHALAGVMVALHLRGGQAAKTMGAIDAVVGVGKMHMQDFVDALSSGIIPTAHAVGLSFNSIGAGLATLTDAGVPAEQAATKMRTILLMLAHEHTTAAVDGLKSVGLSADQVAQTMRKPGNGLASVLELLSTHMKNLSNVKKVNLMSSLAGGSRSAGTLITLLDQMDRVKNKYGQITTLSGQFNSRVAAESATASHKIKVAWSIIQTGFIEAGQKMLPVVSSVLTALEKFVVQMQKGRGAGGAFRDTIVGAFKVVKTAVGSIVGTIENVVKGFQQGKVWAVALVGGLTGLVTVIGVVRGAMLLWTAVTKTMAIAQGILKITMLANPYVAIAAGIAIVVGALVALELKTHFVEKAWGVLKKAFSAVIDWIGGAATKAFAAVKWAAEHGLLGPIGLIISHWNQIPRFFAGLWHGLTSGFKDLWNGIIRGIKTAAGSVFTAVKTLIMAPINFIKGLFTNVYDIGKFLIKGLISGIVSMAKTVASTAVGVVKDAWHGVTGFLGIGSPSKLFHDVGRNVGQGLADGISGSKKTIGNSLTDSVTNPFNNTMKGIAVAMSSGVKATNVGAQGIAQQLNNTLKSFGATTVPAITAVGGKALGVLGITGHATGGYEQPQPRGKIIQVAEGGYPEVVLTTDPKHAKRQQGLLSRYLGAAPNVAKGLVPGFAKGGIVTASDFGGPNDSSAYMHPTASGKTMDGSLVGYAELSNPPGSLNFSALGNLPMGTMHPVTYGGKTVTIPKVDKGAGGAGLNGHIRALDLTQPAANMLNFPGLADVIVGNPAGISLAGGGGAIPNINAPKVKGSGTVAKVVRGALSKMASAANKYAQSHQPTTSVGGGGFGGGAPVGSPGGPTGVGSYMGVQIANWVIESLRYAAAHGSGNPQPTSGYRPGFDSHTSGGVSEHAGTQYPHGAVDFGDYVTGGPAKMAVVNATRGFKWPLLAPIGFSDAGHASGTGHAMGGIVGDMPFVGSFKRGGIVHRTGIAHVHKGEHVVPNAAGMTPPFLYPLDAAIANLAAKIAKLQSDPAPNHNHAIAALLAEITKDRREKIRLSQHRCGQVWGESGTWSSCGR